MATKVRVEKGRVLVGDREASLLSGAVHYWRLHPNSWEDILSSVKDLGLETIETYIPWEFHELEPGVFDFTGASDSRRDLAGFLT
jgi:beta-galactosidase